MLRRFLRILFFIGWLLSILWVVIAINIINDMRSDELWYKISIILIGYIPILLLQIIQYLIRGSFSLKETFLRAFGYTIDKCDVYEILENINYIGKITSVKHPNIEDEVLLVKQDQKLINFTGIKNGLVTNNNMTYSYKNASDGKSIYEYKSNNGEKYILTFSRAIASKSGCIQIPFDLKLFDANEDLEITYKGICSNVEY